MPTSITTLFAALDKGWATLIAASLAALVSFLSLAISIISARAQTRLAARMTDSTNISKETREYQLKQLTSFYDPVYTLLSANREIFERIGPTSVARIEGTFDDAETAEFWGRLAAEVVVPNNERICEVIQAHLHFMASSDDEVLYLEFLTHAHAYKVFKEQPYEAYRLFPFPKKLLENVTAARGNLQGSLADIYGNKKR